jgi:ABC-type branched-subunit amino acid transport system substrate-binding protein
MPDDVRIGLIYTDGELSQSIHEQCLGARLAVEHTRALWGQDGPELQLIERQVDDEIGSVERAAAEVVRDGCSAIVGALSVPVSVRLAQWAEASEVVYATANNNPLVGGGRRHVFHIGVPSEITGWAVARFLVGDRAARRVGLLHTNNDFQAHAANCTAAPLRESGAEVLLRQLGADPSADRAVLEEARDWRADGMMIYDSETSRQVALIRQARAIGGLPPFLHARGMLAREFRDAAAAAAEGDFFVDMMLRSMDAPAEERALHERLRAVDPGLVATASHAFAWDEVRLVAEAWRAAGPEPGAQVRFLEGLRAYPGAGGPLTFTERDHNGRWTQDPTTIAQLIGGEFVVVNRLQRSA